MSFMARALHDGLSPVRLAEKKERLLGESLDFAEQALKLKVSECGSGSGSECSSGSVWKR
jgi:hypothetical protein